jgi:hypothetical protein
MQRITVARHNADSLSVVLGKGFALVDTRRHQHVTPWGAAQHFQFSTFHFVA